MEEPPPYLSWSFPSKHRPQVSITSSNDDPGSSSSPAGAFGWFYAPCSTVSVHHTRIKKTQTFAWPVRSLRLYSSWLMEWTYLKTMTLTMSGFLNLCWPLLQRQDIQAHSSLTHSLPWNSSLHGFRVPDGKERPTTGESSVNIFRMRLGMQSRNSWYDAFHWSLSELPPSEQREGTAEPSIASSLIEKLPDETSPNRIEEEITARNVCAVAFAGEFFHYHQNTNYVEKCPQVGRIQWVIKHFWIRPSIIVIIPDGFNNPLIFHGNGPLPWGPEEGSKRAWQGHWQSSSRVQRSTKPPIYQRHDERVLEMATCRPSGCDSNLLNHSNINIDNLNQSSCSSQFKIWRWI